MTDGIIQKVFKHELESYLDFASEMRGVQQYGTITSMFVKTLQHMEQELIEKIKQELPQVEPITTIVMKRFLIGDNQE